MHISLKTLGAVLLLLPAVPIFAAEDVEPPLAYTLRINGKETRLAPNSEIELKGEFKDPKISLIPDKHRLFTYGGVSFSYPSNFAFEADFSNPGIKIWTLDGSDVVIMLQAYEELKMTPKDLAEVLKQNYGAATKVDPISKTFNGKTYSGLRIQAKVAGTELIQDLLALPSKTGSRILLLQDIPPAQKVSNDETKLVMKLLDETLKP